MKFIDFLVGVGIQFSCCLGTAQAMSESVRAPQVSFQVSEQCGISISVPLIEDAFGQNLEFSCMGSLEKPSYRAIMDMDIQYPPDRVGGGHRIEFLVERVNIYLKLIEKRGGVIQLGGEGLALSSSVAFGDPRKAIITEINGPNWRGWIAEEINTRPFRRSSPDDWFTTKFRCIHLMIGNNRMTAQLGGVCLLRKRTYSLAEGFSYDVFVDMLKTLRFLEE